jgi:hypothetical protein
MSRETKPAIANILVEALRRDLPQLFPQLIAADAKGENRVLLTTGLRGQLLIVCNDPDNFEVAELDYASRPGPTAHCDKKALGLAIVA